MARVSVLGQVPETLKGMRAVQMAQLVVTVTRDPDGNEYVLSRLRDREWNLSPLSWPPNVNEGAKVIRFPQLKSTALVEGMQDALYARMRIGLPNFPQVTGGTVLNLFKGLHRFACWLDERGVEKFSDVSSDMALSYVQYCKTDRKKQGRGKSDDKPLAKRTVGIRLAGVEWLWHVRHLMKDGLVDFPWPGESALSLAGVSRAGVPVRQTKIIPPEVMSKLFKRAEEYIDRASELLDARDMALELKKLQPDWKRKFKKATADSDRRNRDNKINDVLRANGYPTLRALRRPLSLLRTACYMILAITTGMRDHELSWLRSGAFYKSIHDGEEYGWLKATSSKSHDGPSEWMVPISIGKKAIDVLERLSAPYRAQLDLRIAELEVLLRDRHLSPEMRTKLADEWRISCEHIQHLFLARFLNTGAIRTLCKRRMHQSLVEFAQEAGVEWDIHPHQFRATFAVFVAGSVHGDLRYLKEHFKHWSLDMTFMYAMNTKQDEDLYKDLYDEMNVFNARVVDHWLDEKTPLCGRGAERLKEYRKRDEVRTFEDRSAMVRGLSDQLVIRGTGTSWCLADRNGCGGLGMIEKGRCLYCAEGVIDDTHARAWKNIYKQQEELLTLDDIGPGGRQRVLRDLETAEQVLTQLGVDVKSKA